MMYNRNGFSVIRMRNSFGNAFAMQVADLHRTDIRERSCLVAPNLQISPRAELQIQKELFALSILQVTSRNSQVSQSFIVGVVRRSILEGRQMEHR